MRTIIHAKSNKNSLERAESLLSEVPNGLQTALLHAINRSLTEGRTAASKEIRQIYTVPAKTVLNSFHLYKAEKALMEGRIESIGSKIPIHLFAIRPKISGDTTGANRQTFRVGVKREGGLKPFRTGFVWNDRLFARTGQKIRATKGYNAGRIVEQVEKKYGPAVPEMLNNEHIVEKVEDKLRESVDKRLEHETLRLLNKRK